MIKNQWPVISQLVAKELRVRYRSAMLGVAWIIATPLLMLGLFTVVFGIFFGARWTVGSIATSDFALRMFAGLIVYSFFAEVLSRSPELIVSNPNFVTKIRFPLSALSVVSILVSLLGFVAGFLVLLVFATVEGQLPTVATILAPAALVPLVVVSLGLSLLLSAAGVFLRDLRQVASLLSSYCMFMGPVFFPYTAVPESLQWLVLINPVTIPILLFRSLLFGEPAGIGLFGFLVYCAVAVVIFAAATWTFRRVSSGFADAL